MPAAWYAGCPWPLAPWLGAPGQRWHGSPRGAGAHALLARWPQTLENALAKRCKESSEHSLMDVGTLAFDIERRLLASLEHTVRELWGREGALSCYSPLLRISTARPMHAEQASPGAPLGGPPLQS
jgi:hypothetical protein